MDADQAQLVAQLDRIEAQLGEIDARLAAIEDVAEQIGTAFGHLADDPMISALLPSG